MGPSSDSKGVFGHRVHIRRATGSICQVSLYISVDVVITWDGGWWPQFVGVRVRRILRGTERKGVEDMLRLKSHGHASFAVQITPFASRILQEKDRVIQPETGFGVEGLDNDIWIPVPHLKLVAPPLGNHSVGLDDAPSMIVTRQNQIPRMFRVRKPHPLLRNEPAGMVGNIQTAKRVKRTRVVYLAW